MLQKLCRKRGCLVSKNGVASVFSKAAAGATTPSIGKNMSEKRIEFEVAGIHRSFV
jgi:hypothetical protein